MSESTGEAPDHADVPRPDDASDVPLIADAEEHSLSGRLRTQRDHLEARIESTRVRLEDARPNSRVIDTVFRAFERDVATGGGVLSAAVAFRIFLFLVPFVFFLVPRQDVDLIKTGTDIAINTNLATAKASKSAVLKRHLVVAKNTFENLFGTAHAP